VRKFKDDYAIFYQVWLLSVQGYTDNMIKKSAPRKDGGGMGRCPRFFGNGARFLHFKDTTQIMLEITCRSTCDQSNVHVARLETGLRQLVYDYLLYSQSSNNYTGQMSCYRRVYGSCWLTESYRTANDWRTLCAVKSTAIWSSGMYCLFCKANDRKPKYNS
jgi:hypothetical protein